MNFKMINRASDDFEQMCAQCETIIVPENLKKNGGTLNYYNLTYESDFLILCLDGDTPIAFCSLVMLDAAGIYVYQIAVKKEHQKKGIGKQIIDIAKGLATTLGMPLAAHVNAYNADLQNMFEKSGFIKNSDYSDDDEVFYEYKELIKDGNNQEKGLK